MHKQVLCIIIHLKLLGKLNTEQDQVLKQVGMFHGEGKHKTSRGKISDQSAFFKCTVYLCFIIKIMTVIVKKDSEEFRTSSFS